MKTVQMTLDDDLVAKVDSFIKIRKTTRSAFTRQALEHELSREKELDLEQKQIDGYTKYPVETEEFSCWESEQKWGN